MVLIGTQLHLYIASALALIFPFYMLGSSKFVLCHHLSGDGDFIVVCCTCKACEGIYKAEFDIEKWFLYTYALLYHWREIGIEDRGMIDMIHEWCDQKREIERKRGVGWELEI